MIIGDEEVKKLRYLGVWYFIICIGSLFRVMLGLYGERYWVGRLVRLDYSGWFEFEVG